MVGIIKEVSRVAAKLAAIKADMDEIKNAVNAISGVKFIAITESPFGFKWTLDHYPRWTYVDKDGKVTTELL